MKELDARTDSTRTDGSLDLSSSPQGRPLVVQMHGEPGSGKSTLARAIGPRIGAVASRTRTDRSLDLSSSPQGRPLVVQMHGEPGSGKSTLARAIGPPIGAVVLDKDVIKAALLRTGIAEREAAPGAYEVFFAQAHALTAGGHSIILDNPVYWESVERHWLEITREAGSPPLLIECVCPDREVLLRRLANREIVESQPRDPLDLVHHPGSKPTAFRPRLTLDTTRPFDDLIAEVLTYVEAALRPPQTPTPNDQRLATTTP